MTPNVRHRRAARLLVAGGVAAVLALGGCAAGSSSSGPAAPPKGQDGQAAGAPAAGAPAPAASADKAQAQPGAPAGGQPQAVEVDQKLVRSANVTLAVEDIPGTAAAVRGVATGAGGTVTSEDISTSGDKTSPQPSATPARASGPSGVPSPTAIPPGYRGDRGTLTISVPPDKLDTVLDQLARLGHVVQRNSSTQDVTGTYADTQSRIATMRVSIDRVRALMNQAGSIDQVVALERELSRREADLEALQATLARLDKKIAQSTVTVTLLTPTAQAKPTPEPETGFLGGLKSGWSAFLSAVNGLLTVVGAALPFLVAIAVLLAPLALWWRRRPRRGPATLTPAPSRPSEPAPAPASAAVPASAPAQPTEPEPSAG